MRPGSSLSGVQAFCSDGTPQSRIPDAGFFCRSLNWSPHPLYQPATPRARACDTGHLLRFSDWPRPWAQGCSTSFGLNSDQGAPGVTRHRRLTRHKGRSLREGTWRTVTSHSMSITFHFRLFHFFPHFASVRMTVNALGALGDEHVPSAVVRSGSVIVS